MSAIESDGDSAQVKPVESRLNVIICLYYNSLCEFADSLSDINVSNPGHVAAIIEDPISTARESAAIFESKFRFSFRCTPRYRFYSRPSFPLENKGREEGGEGGHDLCIALFLTRITWR